jgi:tRNA(Ile)-lysidine synthase
LRPESGWEALHVEDVCGRLACPHSILSVRLRQGRNGLQAEARRARYGALTTWAADGHLPLLATAHHQDDQAETVLMRLARGAGTAGLAGIRPVRREGAVCVVRPLLGWSKAELVHLVALSGIEPVDDPSNRDTRFDRTSARRLLAANPMLDSARLARSATAAREAEEALEWATDQLLEDRLTTQGGEWRFDPTGLPPALKRRLLLRVLAQVREAHDLPAPASSGPEQDRFLGELESGATATLAEVMARGGAIWRFRLAPPRRGAA